MERKSGWMARTRVLLVKWKGFFYLFPGFGDVEHGFPDFHNFSLNSGKPLSTILVTTELN